MRRLAELLTPFRSGMLMGVLLTVFVLSVAFWGQAENHPPDKPTDQGRNSHAKQESENPVAGWWHWTLTGDSAGLYTLGLITVGTLQIWLFYRQLSLIGESLADTKKAVEASQEAARAASESNKLSRDIFASENRPWLSVHADYKDFKFDSQGTIAVTFHLLISNVGKAPAFSVVTNPISYINQTKLDQFNGIREAAFHVARFQVGRRVPGRTIFPGQSEEELFVARFIKPELEMISDDRSIIPSAFLAIACVYRSALTEADHETSVLYAFGFDDASFPLPRVEGFATGNVIVEMRRQVVT